MGKSERNHQRKNTGHHNQKNGHRSKLKEIAH